MSSHSLSSVKSTISECRAQEPSICPHHSAYVSLQAALESGDPHHYVEAVEMVERAEREKRDAALKPLEADKYGVFAAQSVAQHLGLEPEEAKKLLIASANGKDSHRFRAGVGQYVIEFGTEGKAAFVSPVSYVGESSVDKVISLNNHLMRGAETIRPKPAPNQASLEVLFTLVDVNEAEDLEDMGFTNDDRNDAIYYIQNSAEPLKKNVKSLFEALLDIDYDDDELTYSREDEKAARRWLASQ